MAGWAGRGWCSVSASGREADLDTAAHPNRSIALRGQNSLPERPENPHEANCRPVIKSHQACSNCLQMPSPFMTAYAICDEQRLGLIMGHIDNGRANCRCKSLISVRIGNPQGLFEGVDSGSSSSGKRRAVRAIATPHCHALALPPRQGPGWRSR